MNYNKCKNEQDFKMAWFKRFKRYYADMFCIETEETVGGFPDVMALGYKGSVFWIYTPKMHLYFLFLE